MTVNSARVWTQPHQERLGPDKRDKDRRYRAVCVMRSAIVCGGRKKGEIV